MKVNWTHMLLGLIAGSALPILLGMLISMPQGVKPETFLLMVAGWFPVPDDSLIR